MYHMHIMAHQRYEERIRDAERQARFLAACGLLTTGDPRSAAATPSHPLHHLLSMLRQFRRGHMLQRA